MTNLNLELIVLLARLFLTTIVPPLLISFIILGIITFWCRVKGRKGHLNLKRFVLITYTISLFTIESFKLISFHLNLHEPFAKYRERGGVVKPQEVYYIKSSTAPSLYIGDVDSNGTNDLLYGEGGFTHNGKGKLRNLKEVSPDHNFTNFAINKKFLEYENRIKNLGNLKSGILIGNINGQDMVVLIYENGLSNILKAEINNYSIPNLMEDYPPVNIKTELNNEILFEDFDNDGKEDMIIRSDNTIWIFFQRNLMLTTPKKLELDIPNRIIIIRKTVIADITNDGLCDVVTLICNIKKAGQIKIYPQRKDGTLDSPESHSTGPVPIDMVVGDINGDGKNDIIVANGDLKTISVFTNAM